MTEKISTTENRRKIWLWGLFAVVVFAGVYIFFTKAYPLYIHDLDDWYYLTYYRHPIPDMEQLNPVKVLPETWMPLVSYLGAYLIYPITGDYVGALSMAFAGVVSLMITGYAVSGAVLLGKLCNIREGFAKILYGSLFLLAHFAPFLLNGGRNDHLFYSYDVTCYFNYMLPVLLNLALWMYFFCQDGQWNKLDPEKTGILLLGLYLAVFSSLFHSIILMSLFGMQLLFALIGGIRENLRKKKPWISLGFIGNYIQIHYPKLIALIIWFISMVFQLGGRSEDISGAMELLPVIRAFVDLMINGLNPCFQLTVVGVNLAAVILAISRREERFLIQWMKILGSIGLTIVYLMLVTGKLSPNYFLRADVIISWMSLLIFMTVFSLAYLIKKLPKLSFLVPVLLSGLVCMVLLNGSGFRQVNVSSLPAEKVKAIDDDIVEQIILAQDQGIREVEVLVPQSLATGEWPLDTEMTSLRISDALFFHGITDDRIEVTVVPSPEKDLEFGLK